MRHPNDGVETIFHVAPNHSPIMNDELGDSNPNGLDLNDILFVLFMHKWKVLACSIVGIAAAFFYLVQESGQEFQAKLLVRYVMERSAMDPVESEVKSVNATTNGDNAIKSEVEILTSIDLAEQVAQTVGIERLLSRKHANASAAARHIAAHLKVNALSGSNVIQLSYKDRNPELAKRVLEELVSRYFDKHLQAHRSLGAFAFVSQQTEEVRKQLQQTEEDLKQLKAKAGIPALAENTETVTAAMIKANSDLQAARVELAEQRARVAEIKNSIASGHSPSPRGAQLTGDGGIRQYEDLSADVSRLRQEELNLLAKYTPESRAVQIRRTQIDDLENQRRAIEMKLPAISNARNFKDTSPLSVLNLLSETAHLAAIEARTATLEVQLREIQARAERLSNHGTQIAQLERNKELEEANYKYFEASLEKARIDEALDPSRIPNISVVQKPSPTPSRLTGYLKYAFALAGGGVASGVAVAFLIALVLDPSVKRPRELERRCGIQPLISIPDAEETLRDSLKELRIADANNPPRYPMADSAVVQTLHPFYAAVRDRLALYFELNGIARKPKLVAVAGLSKGAGASTFAAGLAAAFAETGDGKVLLVDMNNCGSNGNSQSHVRPACTLAELLRNGCTRSASAKHISLTVVTGSEANAGRIVPKKFYDLMPDLQASDFDYIIFDMPLFNQTSITIAMAGLMDKFLLIVQAEKDHQEVVKRANRELLAASGHVSVILNKVRSHVPEWLNAEL